MNIDTIIKSYKFIIWDWLGTLSDDEIIFEQAKSWIRNFSANGVEQNIVSNGSEKLIEKILIENNYREYFNQILGAYSCLPLKPNPDMILYVIKNEMESNLIEEQDLYNQIVFIGDSESDLLAANNAKIPFINVRELLS